MRQIPVISILSTCLIIACARIDKPNVFFIAVDDLTCFAGCYGDEMAHTPHLDRLAQKGVLFSHAYNQIPLCNPSGASLMTGLRPDRVGKIYHYDVPAAIGTNGMDDPVSWDQVVNPKGRDTREEHLITNAEPHRPISAALSWLDADGGDDEQTDGMITNEAIRLLKEHRTGPFFLAVGYFRPHTPYVAPEKYFDLYPIDSIRLPWSPESDRKDIPPADLDGRSLEPLLDDPERDWKGAACTQILRPGDGNPVMGRSIRTNRWRFTEWNEGREGRELYDHLNDPGEFTNLADDPSWSDVITDLRLRLQDRASGKVPETPFNPERL